MTVDKAVTNALEAMHLVLEDLTRALKARDEAIARQMNAITLTTGFNPAWKDENGRLTKDGRMELDKLMRVGATQGDVARRLQLTYKSAKRAATNWAELKKLEDDINRARANHKPPMPPINYVIE